MVQSLGQLLVQQGVLILDRQLPMVADQPGYHQAVEVFVPTRSPPRPVDKERLLILDGAGIQLDPDLRSQSVSAR